MNLLYFNKTKIMFLIVIQKNASMQINQYRILMGKEKKSISEEKWHIIMQRLINVIYQNASKPKQLFWRIEKSKIQKTELFHKIQSLVEKKMKNLKVQL